jgi:hypothetical protein
MNRTPRLVILLVAAPFALFGCASEQGKPAVPELYKNDTFDSSVMTKPQPGLSSPPPPKENTQGGATPTPPPGRPHGGPSVIDTAPTPPPISPEIPGAPQPPKMTPPPDPPQVGF